MRRRSPLRTPSSRKETQAVDLSGPDFKATGLDTLFQSLKTPNQFSPAIAIP